MPTSVYEMDGSGISNDMTSTYAAMQNLADYNSAQSAAQAKIQRDWQEKQNAKAMEFNANEAAKNRDWQQYMSNTAHQREIADLKAAGLNPVLSAMNGNGASVGSGATASGVTSSGAKGEVDMSTSRALVDMVGTLMTNQTRLQEQAMSAVNNLAVADRYTETSRIVQSMINENAQYLAKYYPNNSWQAIGSIRNIAEDLLGSSSGQSAVSKAKDAVTTGVGKVKDWYVDSGTKDFVKTVVDTFKNDLKSSKNKNGAGRK